MFVQDVYDSKNSINYWGALCKIKAKENHFDTLYQKRVVTIQFGCNGRVSNARFKGTVQQYGYATHGEALRKDALLRMQHLRIDPNVLVTINMRSCCKCTHNKPYPQCSRHKWKKKRRKRIKVQSSKITNFFPRKSNIKFTM